MLTRIGSVLGDALRCTPTELYTYMSIFFCFVQFLPHPHELRDALLCCSPLLYCNRYHQLGEEDRENDPFCLVQELCQACLVFLDVEKEDGICTQENGR